MNQFFILALSGLFVWGCTSSPKIVGSESSPSAAPRAPASPGTGDVGSVEELGMNEEDRLFFDALFPRKENLGPQLRGGVRQILNIQQALKNVEALKKVDCNNADVVTHWNVSAKHSLVYKKKRGELIVLRYIPCEPYYRDSKAFIRLPGSKDWFLLEKFPNVVQWTSGYGSGAREAYHFLETFVIQGYIFGNGSMQSPISYYLTVNPEGPFCRQIIFQTHFDLKFLKKV